MRKLFCPRIWKRLSYTKKEYNVIKTQFKEIKMKKVINTAAFAALIVGAAVTAQAADITVNMYGASAQRDYWKDLGGEFMTSQMGCLTAHKAKGGSNYYVIKGESCSQNAGDDVYITYASVASLEGVRAAKGVAPIDSTLDCNSDITKRKIVDKSTCTWPAWQTGEGVCTEVNTKEPAGAGTYACETIQLGTSDVEGSSFDQESHGLKFGHVPASSTNTWQDITLTPESTTGMVSYKPTIVPFAFYANNELGGASPVGDLSNLTRTQAVNLFAGKVATWDQLKGFGDYSEEIMLCLRHAGSGTHATLDKAVFRGDNLDVIKTAKDYENFSAPYAYFYQSSSSTKTGEAGMKECIESNGGVGPFMGVIAMGYLDADAAATTKMHQMKYQGSPAVDAAAMAAGTTNDYINQGSYDFWSAQNVYLQTADDTAFVQKLMAYASTHIPTSKAGIWTTDSDLNVTKASDTVIPVMDEVVVE
jgi:hypothetical protein